MNSANQALKYWKGHSQHWVARWHDLWLSKDRWYEDADCLERNGQHRLAN